MIKKTFHSQIYFFGLALMVVSLPLSLFLISISEFLMAGAWLLEGNYRQKIKTFFRNKTALIITGVFFMHLLGLIYSSNFDFALKDLRIKLPLLILPFIISTSAPIDFKKFKILLNLFILSVFAGTLVSVSILIGIIDRPIYDIREISIFISHIRFSLMICLAIFSIGYLFYKNIGEWNAPKKTLAIFFVLWFSLFLIILQSITGLLILSILLLLHLFYFALRQKIFLLKTIFLTSVILIPLSGIILIKKVIEDYNQIQTFPGKNEVYTAKGNKYENYPDKKFFENGYPVWQYICWPELEESWNKRSSIKLNEKDLKGNEISYTLIRFLSSKGIKKDAEGVTKLSDKEVHSIEKGIPNVNYQDIWNIKNRIHIIIWEYDNYIRGGNPSGHSVTQRIEFWKTAVSIIKEKPIFGVGTGDIVDSFHQQYDKLNSALGTEYRLRSHNQYLSIGVAFGIVGLAYFIYSLIFCLYHNKNYRNYLYLIFWIIAILSMVTEDTLETQAGVTFFAFFNAFLLFGKSKD
jgi:hypothetical protein